MLRRSVTSCKLSARNAAATLPRRVVARRGASTVRPRQPPQQRRQHQQPRRAVTTTSLAVCLSNSHTAPAPPPSTARMLAKAASGEPDHEGPRFASPRERPLGRSASCPIYIGVVSEG
eukprot:355782-Chlamydomonas_euryale.AAC.7